MKNIRRIQYEKVRDLYQSLMRFRDERPDIGTIEKLANEVLYSSIRTPMSGKYRLPRHDLVDVNSLNVELGLTKSDIETIYDYIDIIQKKLRTMKYVADVWKQNAANKVQATMMELAQMTAPAFIHGFTEELNLAEVMSQEDTTLIVESDGSVTLPMVVNKARRHKHTGNDVVVQRIGEGLEATILGNPTKVVNMDESGSLTMTLSGQRLTEAGFRIEINTDMQDVNYIYLQMGNVRNGILVKAEVSSDRSKYTTVYEQVVTRDRVDIPITETDIRKLIITLTMSTPNVVLMNEVRYEFKVDKILMLSDKRKLSGRFQTKEMEVEKDVAFLSLAVDDEVIGKALIKYYIATEKDTSGNPTGFFFLDPKREGSLVNLKSSTSILRIGPKDLSNPRWNLTGIKEYGSRLYNILNVLGTGITEETEDFKVEDGKLALTEGDLIQDTVKMYRGANDYIRKEKEVKIERHVDWISTIPDENEPTKWLNRILLRLRVNELVDARLIGHSGGAYYNEISVPYRILNYEEIRVTRDDGREISTIISNVSYANGQSTVAFYATTGSTLFNPAYKYYISFIISLKEYSETNSMEITIDMDSIRIAVGEEDLIYGTDFTIYKNDMEIELFRSGKYLAYYDVDYSTPADPVNNCTAISMSYRFTGDTGSTMAYHETYVYAEVPTDIVIIPFTTGELAKGNFHIINDDHVGSRSSYTFKQGWNKIETTQPFPSRNEYDPNHITGLVSKACIVIPEDIGKMRAYKDSMRQVAPFTLASMDLEEGSKCFSFVDGQLLVNFIPTFIEKTFLDDTITSDISGEMFLNKKASFGAAYDNVGWIPNPETFSLEFSYTSGDEKRVYVRIDIECDDSTSIGRVLKLGLNKYREV